jgi:hypothetical protein
MDLIIRRAHSSHDCMHIRGEGTKFKLNDALSCITDRTLEGEVPICERIDKLPDWLPPGYFYTSVCNAVDAWIAEAAAVCDELELAIGRLTVYDIFGEAVWVKLNVSCGELTDRI